MSEGQGSSDGYEQSTGAPSSFDGTGGADGSSGVASGGGAGVDDGGYEPPVDPGGTTGSFQADPDPGGHDSGSSDTGAMCWPTDCFDLCMVSCGCGDIYCFAHCAKACK